MQTRLEEVKLFTAKATTGTTVAFPIADRQHIFLSCFTASSANFTLKVQISNAIAAPDFSAAASVTNPRSYQQITLSTTKAALDGATGITSAGTDIAMNYTVNTDGARRIGATITAISAGTITLGLSAKNNG